MNDNKNTSSKLDGLFENARKQEPVMNLNEVSELLNNPAAFQKKKESNTIRWFGIFLLIGLTTLGAFYFYNGNSSSEKEADNALTVTTVTSSNSIAAPQKSTNPGNSNELSATVSSKNNTGSAENFSNENKEVKNSALPKEVIAKESGKTDMSAKKPEAKREELNRHYEGNATISFSSSDNKKIKMIVTSSNEVEELKVNDETISNDKYSSYKNIIDEGLKLKKANSKDKSGSAEIAANSEKQQIMNAMMKELTADGLVSSTEPFDFTLTGQEVILNNEKQSQVMFEKYKQVYEKTTGEKLPSKYNLHIKR